MLSRQVRFLHIMKIRVLFFLFCFFSLLYISSAGADTPDRNSLNVLLITLDTTRPDHLGCYGYEKNTTPNIDRIAGEAIVFSSAYTSIPLTTPSHTSIMTGLNPDHHQVYRNSYPVHDRFTMMAEMLKREGFATGAFISVKLLSSRIGFGQGFDTFSEIKQEAERDRKGIRNAMNNMAGILQERKANETIDETITWLEQNMQKRFFTWVHLYDPHLSYTPPEKYGLLYNPAYESYLERIRNPIFRRMNSADLNGTDENDSGQKSRGTSVRPQKKGFADVLFRLIGLDRKEFMLPQNITPDLANDLIAAYNGEIRFADDQIERIFTLLKQGRVYDRTVIIIMADHGEILYEKEDYFGHHRYLYQGSLRIPLIIKIPGLGPKTLQQTADTIDVLPTLLDILGITPKVKFDGHSLLPAIKNGTAGSENRYRFYVTHSGDMRRTSVRKKRSTFVRKIRRTMYRIRVAINKIFKINKRWKLDEHYDKIAVIEDDWKLIRSRVPGKKHGATFELYNLTRDPGEVKNLVEEEPEIYKKLKRILDRYRKQKRFQTAPPLLEGLTPEEKREEIRTLRSLGYM